MEIIEQSITGKRSIESCEDGIAINDNFIAVIDGSTSKSNKGKLKDGRTQGQIAMQTVKELIHAADPMFDLATFCHHATEMIRMQYVILYGSEIIPYLEKHPEERFCCSAIVYSRYWNEIWMIGDCHGLIIDSTNPKDHPLHITNNKPYESRLARKRSEILTNALQNGATIEELQINDMGRQAILPDLIEEMKNENITYPVIDGFHIPLQKVKVYTNFTPGIEELVLATDGYPRLFPTLTKTESYLQKCLAEDPLCIKKIKATKGYKPEYSSFDDRAYVRFKLS